MTRQAACSLAHQPIVFSTSFSPPSPHHPSLLQHPNVLSLMGACVDGEPIVIFMEYCAHGNLKTYLVRKRREAAAFRESGKLVTIACHMAAGLTYLHSNNVAHKSVMNVVSDF